jgi:chemotaxis protein CheY-P-specific phosphatase CheC
MSAMNSFLGEFIKMRKEMTPPGNAANAPGAVKKAGTNTKHQSKSTAEVMDTSLQRIIDNKPHKKEVIEYLQERANAYTVKKMNA